ncbi:hypothetical protein D3C73_1499400 [compost metagenome]
MNRFLSLESFIPIKHCGTPFLQYSHQHTKRKIDFSIFLVQKNIVNQHFPNIDRKLLTNGVRIPHVYLTYDALLPVYFETILTILN